MSVEVAPGVQALAEAWAQQHYPTGEVFLSMCGICGHFTWTGGSTSAERRVVVYPRPATFGEVLCPRCREVQTRAPEVFTWALSVLQLHHYLKHFPEDGK